MATSQDIAWLAGLYEGEGCLSRSHSNGQTVAYVLSITSRDLDVILKAHAIAGVGKSRESRQPGPHTYWIWNVAAQADLAYLVPLLLPHLCTRRAAKAVECLTWLESRGLF